MLTLGIETSCDETACAIVEDGRKVISNNVISQIELHKEFGGVKPSIAKFAHEEVIDDLVSKTLLDAKIKITITIYMNIFIAKNFIIVKIVKLYHKKMNI